MRSDAFPAPQWVRRHDSMGKNSQLPITDTMAFLLWSIQTRISLSWRSLVMHGVSKHRVQREKKALTYTECQAG